MRIRFVVSTFPLRSQTFVTTQILAALRSGHDVSIACRSVGPGDVLSRELRGRLAAARMFAWPPSMPGPAWLSDRLPNRLRSWLDRRRRARGWSRMGPTDVVIAHFGYAGRAVAGTLQAFADPPPLVTIYHGRDVAEQHRRDGLAGYRQLFERGDLHLTVNAPFARLLVSAGAPSEAVATHHLGVPVDDYAFAPTVRGDVLRLVVVTRLVPKKGLDVAIEALTLLARRRPEIAWRFDIGGEGPCEAALRAQVEDAGLGDRVHFAGPMDHADTLALIARADALVLPSRTAADGDQEGIPVTLMEAMALGTVVCSTRHSGIPELVEHGTSGLLAEEGDAEGLFDAIVAVADGTVDLDAMARAARATVERDFDETRQNEALIARCRSLVAGGANGRRRE